MKKTLLSALFCGFVLNNGYCFDEEHKITNEYLNESINDLREERVPDLEQSGNSDDQLNRSLENFRRELLTSTIPSGRDDRRSLSAVLGIDAILRNACKFAGEFLKTQIPSGEDKGKIVGELLIEHKLSNDHMQRICDDSVKYNVEDSGDRVLFGVDRLRTTGRQARIVIGNGYVDIPELIDRDTLRAICDESVQYVMNLNGYMLHLN